MIQRNKAVWSQRSSKEAEDTQYSLLLVTKSSIRFAKSLGFNDIELGCEDGGRFIY